MKLSNVSFIEVSELLDGLMGSEELHEILSNSSNITYGNSERCLYKASAILRAVSGDLTTELFNQLYERVQQLPGGKDCLVDVEH
jgi:hypothetical protein